MVAATVAGAHPVFLVDTDGTPSVRGKFVPEPLPANERARRERTDADVLDVAARVAGLRADAPDADVFGALTVTARATRTGAGSPAVLLVDSGLQTVAPLDFTQPGVLSADPAEIVTFLTRAHTLPDLTGVAVLLAGIGATTSPQTPLTDPQITHLRAIYRAVFTAAGATCVDFLDTVPDRTSADNPHLVPTVPVPTAPAFTATATVLDSDTLRFQPESAEIADLSTARAVLAPVVTALRGNPALRLQITGTTSTGIPGQGRDRVELSTARAESVRALLIEQGVAADRLTTRGVGTDFPEFVPDLTADGTLLPGPAARNRSVRLQPIH
ncbi:OmpA family protein [Nocardia thailandica]